MDDGPLQAGTLRRERERERDKGAKNWRGGEVKCKILLFWSWDTVWVAYVLKFKNEIAFR